MHVERMPAGVALDVEPPSGAAESREAVESKPAFESEYVLDIPALPWWYAHGREIAAATGALVIGLALGVAAGGRGERPAMDTGRLVVSTHPTAATVVVDGRVVGTAPVALDVSPGFHDVAVREVERSADVRTFGVEVLRGESVARHVDLSAPSEPGVAAPAASATRTGSLSIDSQPAGATVEVDGASRGVTPLTLDRLSPGQHLVELRTETGSAEQRVTVTAGSASRVSFWMPDRGDLPLGGWIVLPDAPAVEVFEGGNLLGTTAQSRIMVRAGRHELTLVNESIGLRVSQAVEVPAGSHVAVRLD